MAIPFDTPISAIEGIGAATESAFQARAVFSVFDLLRAASPDLHGAVAALASRDEVRAWRQMAVLLEVAAVTPQWAEALVRGGVTSVSELRRLDLDELTTLFDDAVTARTIPTVPTTGQMVAMLTDASLLEYAGAITGTIRDREGRPVEGADVAGGGAAATTDGRGRFRLRRLRLGQPIAVSMSKEGLAASTAEVTPVPTATVLTQQFVLVPAVATRPRPSGRTAGDRLREIDGQAMPAPVGGNVTSGEIAADTLESGDLLVLSELDANGRDVKLVSKLLEHDGARIVVHWVRLPKADLPADAAVGDHFLRAGTAFRRIAMNPRKLAAYKKLLAARRGLPPRAPATTLEERYQRTAETLALMSRRDR